MGITADGWFDWAIRDPGYPGGVNGGVNPVKGIVPHSAEGDFLSLEHLHDFHWSRATAPPNQRASWGATVLTDGYLVQHYPIYAQTWTSGCAYLNNNFFAWENEGRAGQPLTDGQNATNIRMIRELSALKGWKLRRPINSADKNATAYEHNESVRFGGAATACPSGRIPWSLYLAALGEDVMKEATFWIGKSYPKGDHKVNLRADFGAGRAYLVTVISGGQNRGTISFGNGDNLVEAARFGGGNNAETFVIRAAADGLAPFTVIGPDPFVFDRFYCSSVLP